MKLPCKNCLILSACIGKYVLKTEKFKNLLNTNILGCDFLDELLVHNRGEVAYIILQFFKCNYYIIEGSHSILKKIDNGQWKAVGRIMEEEWKSIAKNV